MKPIVLLLLLNFFKTPYSQAQPVARVPQTALTTSYFTSNNVFLIQNTDSTIPNQQRVYLLTGIHAAAYAGTLVLLSSAWYNNYTKTPFHLFNDSKEWLQLDKAGHAWTAYSIANYSTRLWQWSGLSHRKAVLLGGFSSLGYQTILEYMDAHSAKWGWSWADIGANSFGVVLYSAQELSWQKQHVLLKFSSFPQRHDKALQARADALFGKTFPERLLKDYNGQTYWASFNLQSLFHAPLPTWLNVAIGYGATGMYGGFENKAMDENGIVVFDRRDIRRIRQWYFAPDVDWTKLRTNKKAIRTLFGLMNMIKLPAPAVEWSRGKLKAHWISF